MGGQDKRSPLPQNRQTSNIILSFPIYFLFLLPLDPRDPYIYFLEILKKIIRGEKVINK